MVVQQLRRIAELAGVSEQELRACARSVTVLSIPAGRWLVQPPRAIDAHFYLLRGRVQTWAPRRRVIGHRFGPLQHFYPGSGSARTLTPCQILRMDNARREFLLSQAGEVVAPLATDAWLARFLESGMMQRLPAASWQRLLAVFEAETFSARAPILVEGALADRCYVIEQGHAVVHRDGHTLCHLGPGDFFGEDALVLNAKRTANVTALEPMRVHGIAREAFEQGLLRNLVQPVPEAGAGVELALDGQGGPAAVPVQLRHLREQAAGLDPCVVYFVTGGRDADRCLCALLLIQRGLQAHPVQARGE